MQMTEKSRAVLNVEQNIVYPFFQKVKAHPKRTAFTMKKLSYGVRPLA